MNRPIVKTDNDALVSKVSCVDKKYYSDPLIHLFCAKSQPRLPLMNIGTFCRVKGVDLCIHDFLQTKGKKRIISLGAGSDTRCFHLLPENKDLKFVELDFPESTKRKIKVIESSNELQSRIGTFKIDNNSLFADNYSLIGCDIKSYNPIPDDVPTLVLAECCLCYLRTKDANDLLTKFSAFENLSLVVYEPMGLNDDFGRVMISNLENRGLFMPTLYEYPDLNSQLQRYKQFGLNVIKAGDILTVYTQWLASELPRISKLELLDEVEEMNLLMKHYSIIYLRN